MRGADIPSADWLKDVVSCVALPQLKSVGEAAAAVFSKKGRKQKAARELGRAAFAMNCRCSPGSVHRL
jgi:hypothetical protein